MAVGRLVETLLQSIVPHTHEWFPDQPHSGLEVRVLADRPKCLLLTVHLDGAEVPAALAKFRRDSVSRPGAGTRPRLRDEPATVEQLTVLEWSGLAAIERACGDTAGLGVVRPLLLMRDDAGIVMSFTDAPTLRNVVLDLSRLRRGRGSLDDAIAGCTLAGRWLRTFQERSEESDRPVRQGTREVVVDRLRAYGEFLDSRDWRRVATKGTQLVSERLPRELPLTVGHGDFAPRNMLLRDGRLTVLDPLPRWRVPTYDDLCRFLVGIRLIGEQVHTHGLAFGAGALDALEAAVVAAYLGPHADQAPLRAYELLILMDKWTAMLDNPRRDVPGRIARRSAALADHRVRAEAERLLDLASQG
ncbi:phosphotransferase [Nocardioides sp.]|uniref:phosphotransferase n=1 Tax=Nocardioides sp. TaxID=35761 RepID=UPI002F3FE8BF